MEAFESLGPSVGMELSFTCDSAAMGLQPLRNGTASGGWRKSSDSSGFLGDPRRDSAFDPIPLALTANSLSVGNPQILRDSSEPRRDSAFDPIPLHRLDSKLPQRRWKVFWLGIFWWITSIYKQVIHQKMSNRFLADFRHFFDYRIFGIWF
jgi:hypothetical protein